MSVSNRTIQQRQQQMIGHLTLKKDRQREEARERICRLKQKQFTVLHYIDHIYEGEINQSYQKDGFGVIQTIDFDTYLGFFKNNKAHGLGLIVYPSGQRIYAQFSKDDINGVVIAQTADAIRVGYAQKTQNGFQWDGIGYEYQWMSQEWKMMKFQRGQPTQIRQHIYKNIQAGIPSMITNDLVLYRHITQYLSHNYFQPILSESDWQGIEGAKFPHFNSLTQNKPVDLESHDEKAEYLVRFQEMYVHWKGNGVIHIGLQDEDGYYGLGLNYSVQNRTVGQIGYYQGGNLSGYGFKNSKQHQEVGMYVEGRKEGIFYEKSKEKEGYYIYHHNDFIGPHVGDPSALKKMQKLANFSNKSFISSKLTLSLTDFARLFDDMLISSRPTKGSKKTSNSLYKIRGYIKDQTLPRSVDIMKEKLKTIKKALDMLPDEQQEVEQEVSPLSKNQFSEQNKNQSLFRTRK